jgi:hypothetical protein
MYAQGYLSILQLPPEVLILFWVQNCIPPTMSETAESGQQPDGIVGVIYITKIILCDINLNIKLTVFV